MKSKPCHRCGGSGVEQTGLVRAGDLHGGQCFRKKTGEYVYVVISPSSARFAGMDEAFVWGVSFNGNLAKVDPSTMVVPKPLSAMTDNLEGRRQWERSVGVHRQDYESS